VKLGVVCDYLEEGWMSMDICAQMLLDRAWECDDLKLQPMQIRPPFQWRLKYLQEYFPQHFTADRVLNRFVDYPQYLRAHSTDYDLFHLVDHSYAHLVGNLPAARTGVYCADLDAFRSILAPDLEPRPWAYRQMTARILKGLQSAAIVFYPTQEIRKQIEHYQLIDPARLILASPGVSAEYDYRPSSGDEPSDPLLAGLPDRPFILHVGSCISRKRIDILLATFAELRHQLPELHLVKVGGSWTHSQQQQIVKLGIETAIVHLTDLPNATIARLYRQAQLVLMTSEAEGFGMPVIEALACGAIVVASDIPVLQEVGSDAVIYCPVGNLDEWVTRSLEAIRSPARAPSLERRLARAADYTWDNYANNIMAAYIKLERGEF
jgi:glycosyltransferase involved in cell wall biosynthesis